MYDPNKNLPIHSVGIVFGSNSPPKKYFYKMRRRFWEWLLERPFAIAEWFANWKTVLIVLGLVAYVRPEIYIWTLKMLPQSYYYVGSLKDPADTMKLSPWNIDLNWVDNAKRADRLGRILSSSGKIARLGKDAYIPGRRDASGSEDEYLGRQWNGGSCLYIAGVKLVAARTNSNGEASPISAARGKTYAREIDTEHPMALNAYWSTLPKDFRRRCAFTDVGGCKAKALLNCDAGSTGKACRDKVDIICAPEPASKTCPAIAIWLRGTPVPCFLL